MIPYPHINPEIIRVGPLAIRWYGLMYLIGFASSYLLVKHQIEKRDFRSTGISWILSIRMLFSALSSAPVSAM